MPDASSLSPSAGERLNIVIPPTERVSRVFTRFSLAGANGRPELSYRGSRSWTRYMRQAPHSSRAARPRRRQRIAAFRISGGHVKIERTQIAAAGVADLMLVVALDQQQGAGFEPVTFAVDPGGAGARDDEQPLIGAVMPVFR